MIERRPFNQLGGEDHGWLKAKHHFSFGDYHDVAKMGWGSLRVWNDDEIAPDTGFPPHPHANMEIVTYVREGAVTHKDSLGNEGRTEAGDVQVMSAGTGIREFSRFGSCLVTRVVRRLGGHDPFRRTIARDAS
jgi:quercetin 2,3-dioxygenase